MIHLCIEEKLQAAVRAVLPDADASRIWVRPCPDLQHGDYQTNALMALAKQQRRNPRELAAAVVAQLDVTPWCARVEIAGPGFLNFHLAPHAINAALQEALRTGNSFFAKATTPRTIVIDFSSPNVAKPMHVGHIRSTILGDALARVFRLLGHRVITDNHIGDWGTQFGMLLVGWKTLLDAATLERDPIAEMERLYQAINLAAKEDERIREQARAELVKLQSGDAENLGIWRRMLELSQSQFDNVYGRLGIQFDHTLGESFYNDQLGTVLAELARAGIAEESDGALVVFFRDHATMNDNPAIIRKSDGAANYASTDLATLRHRVEQWQAQEILYVTDGRQQLHFQQVFTIYQRWHPQMTARLEHVWFGSILGPDGKPFKTREGGVVKLAALLDEAEERALTAVTQKNPDLDEATRREIARAVGLGALKYADLSNNRQSDYTFDWDKMLALQGNTAPYLQYACTRVRSIFRKGEVADLSGATIALAAPQELVLAKRLLNFGIALETVAAEYRPNYLCNYLYELAGDFTAFYEACPVLKAGDAERQSRLALCKLTGQVLHEGLGLLGIEVPEKM